MSLTPLSSITSVKGIGNKKASLYHKLGIHTVGQLIALLPRDYIDLTRLKSLDSCLLGENALVEATIVAKSHEQRIRKGLSVFKVRAQADGIPLQITFFNNRYAVDALKIDQAYLFYGILTGNLLTREMSAPMILHPSQSGSMMPVYPGTSGLSSRVIAKDIQMALGDVGALEDPIPLHILEEHSLLGYERAVRLIHHPVEEADILHARKRILFGELLIFCLSIQIIRQRRIIQRRIPMQQIDLNILWEHLPFSPTDDQLSAIKDVCHDLCSGQVMNRLIQGDVGSGKTLVAAACAYFCWKNGGQAALMVPTELLARQHADSLTRLLTPLGMTVGLLTGSMGIKDRRELLASLKAGKISLLVGTHALLTPDVVFNKLSLVITDEQHRFGVAQRAALTAKHTRVHTLVMSATPIPRTLSLILYGDLDVSTIRQLPVGRKQVETYHIDSGKRLRAFSFIKKMLDQGQQGYLVCPLIEENETGINDLISAEEYFKDLSNGEFSAYRLGLLHGRMKPHERASVMTGFISGQIDLLICTTVIEVGVDVKNANVMLIENAERFGLSQLHQLRGRVGRGFAQAYCILVSDSKNQTTRERLSVLCSTNDGFKIAEEDLKLRGPGDYLGIRQHGMPGLENADLVRDTELLTWANTAASGLLAQDPDLSHSAHQALRTMALHLLEQIGTTPN